MCASINIVFFLFQIEFDTPRKQRCLVFNSISGQEFKKFQFLRENAEPKEEKFFFFQATNKTLFKLVKKPNNEKVF